jgi:disulfide bond formation protein DsbB
MKPKLKGLYTLGALTCLFLIVFAYYFEYALELEPCPLCIMQRVAVFMVGLGCIIGALTSNIRFRTHIVIAIWIFSSSIFGIWLADHHRWLQGLPADLVPSCGPSLDYMIKSFPLSDIIRLLLRGNGSCAKVSWSFLSLSMPVWVEIFFILFSLASLIGLYQIIRGRPKKRKRKR